MGKGLIVLDLVLGPTAYLISHLVSLYFLKENEEGGVPGGSATRVLELICSNLFVVKSL